MGSRCVRAAAGSISIHLGVRERPAAPVTHEEIKMLMEQGEFREHEQALVSRVFRMDEQRITAVMTPRADIDYYDLNDPAETNRRESDGARRRRDSVRGWALASPAEGGWRTTTGRLQGKRDHALPGL